MTASLSILGLYNFDNTIFDNMVVPTGVVKEDVTNNLLLELEGLEILYPNPVTMKAAIGFWSKNELPVWTKLYNTTVLEYNPLENAYRTETTTNTETRNLSGSNNQTRNLTGSNNEIRDLTTGGTHGSTTTGTTTNNGTDTNSEYVIAFNDAATNPTLKAKTEQTLGTGNTVSGTVTNTDTGTDSGTVNHSITDSGTVNNATSDTGTITNSNEFSLKGSIGIITPQQMIEQERNVVKFNIADYIIDSFKTRFCILVY